jgi:hypothetical protein
MGCGRIRKAAADERETDRSMVFGVPDRRGRNRRLLDIERNRAG